MKLLVKKLWIGTTMIKKNEPLVERLESGGPSMK